MSTDEVSLDGKHKQNSVNCLVKFSSPSGRHFIDSPFSLQGGNAPANISNSYRDNEFFHISSTQLNQCSTTLYTNNAQWISIGMRCF